MAWTLDGVAGADRMLADGAEIDSGGRRLVALYTPGHRFDHLCFLLLDSDILFAGDLVAGTGTVVIAPPEGDLADYLASLRRLLALDIKLILPGHGPVIARPRDLLEGYIQHREEREAQVLAGLVAGDRTVGELVMRIYAAVDPALHPVAALSVTAHLEKLEREGRVGRVDVVSDTTMWRLIP
jgi:glyoxylase-like metal-dependent hydrolase (beta-lactamase superfamily II)